MDQRQIGKFIAELRNEKGMTQSELGEKMALQTKQFPVGKTEIICRTYQLLQLYVQN